MSDAWRKFYDESGNAICPICRGGHRVSEHPTEPDYIVIRAGEGLPAGFLPPDMDGRWYDRSTVPFVSDEQAEARDEAWKAQGGSVGSAVAVPTDRFEVRDDGAVAQVWEMRP